MVNPGEQPAHESGGWSAKAAKAAAWVMLALLGIALGWHEIGSPDIGFHLSTARWIVENGRLPTTDPFTWTVSDHAYIDLQWLFQLLCYGLERVGGATPLAILTTVLTLGFMGLLAKRTAREFGALPTTAAFLLLLFALGNNWEIRPHLLSWVLGSCLLLVFEEYARGNRRWLWTMPIIMVVWVNCHSLFILGVVILGAYALGELLRGRQADRRMLLWAGGAAAACLLNPYHIHGILFPFTQLAMISGEGGFKSTQMGIAEFASPFKLDHYFVDGHFVLFREALYWQAYTVLALVGTLAGWRRWRLAQWLLLTAFLYAFWRGNKNFGYFVMVSLPMASVGWTRLVQMVRQSLARGTDTSSARGSTVAAGALGGLFALLAIAASWGWLDQAAWIDRQRRSGFNARELPIALSAFINEHHIAGRMLNGWDDGGWLAWQVRQPIFIYSHGEVTGPRFFRRYMSGREPGGFEEMLQRWQPTVAVVPFKRTPYWLYALAQSEEWRLVYADHAWALLLHGSCSPSVPAIPRPRVGRDFPRMEQAQAVDVIERAVAAPARGWAAVFVGMGDYPLDAIAQAGFHMQMGNLEACIDTCLRALSERDYAVPELLLTLGHALNARRAYALADQCFDAFIKADPDPQMKREIARVRRARRR